MKPTEDISVKEALQKEYQEIKKLEETKVEELKKMIEKFDINVSNIFRRSTDEIDIVVNEVKRSLSENKGRPVNGTDATLFRSVMSDWEYFKKVRVDLEKFVQRDIHKTKETDEKVKTYLRNTSHQRTAQIYKNYINLINTPKKEKEDEPLFKNKTPAPRHKELEKYVASASEISLKAQEIHKLRIKKSELNDRITEMERDEMDEKTKNEIQKKEKEIIEALNREHTIVRNQLATALKDIEQKNRPSDVESEKLAALLLHEDQLEPHFQTCFSLETLEQQRFEQVLNHIKEIGWEGVLRNAKLLPKVSDHDDPIKALVRTWNQDQQVLARYKEAKLVSSRMKILEDRTLGEKILEDERTETELHKSLKKEITNGKLVEKVVTMALAEKLKNTEGYRVIPVDTVIDIKGNVDCAVSISSPKDPAKIALLGLDITTNPMKVNQGQYSYALHLKESSVKQMLGENAIKSNANILRGDFRMMREVILIPTHVDFEASLINQLYHVLKEKPVKDLSPEIVLQIYQAARLNLPVHVKNKPISIEAVIAKISKRIAV